MQLAIDKLLLELSLYNYVKVINAQYIIRGTLELYLELKQTGHMDIKLFPKHVLGGNFMINLAFKGLSWYGFGY